MGIALPEETVATLARRPPNAGDNAFDPRDVEVGKATRAPERTILQTMQRSSVTPLPNNSLMNLRNMRVIITPRTPMIPRKTITCLSPRVGQPQR